uniref:RNA binding motif protein 27 n=1 Tax=Tetraodon nigroviridis TaxID=99883 RepID=H3DLI3_TETNG
MIIENVEALKSWLAKLLEPICNADPSTLANYVVALVKKDKPEKELKALCADQLDVFLQKETMGFVDKLFDCLTTKNYLGISSEKDVPKEEVKPVVVKSDPVETETPEEDRENRRRKSPPRTRSDFSDSRVFKQLSDTFRNVRLDSACNRYLKSASFLAYRGREDRRRDERKRRDLDRHGKSWSDSHRERERHERRRGSPRGRSRSRSKSGSRGKEQRPERVKSATSWLAKKQNFKSKFDLERKDSDCYNSSTPSGSQQPHPPPLLPLPTPPHPFSSSSSAGPTGAGSCPAATPAHLPDSTRDSWSGYYGAQRPDGVNKPFPPKIVSLKQRCRDYDEKGFCVRGDLCAFDHGNDPLIVDDVNLPGIIPYPPPPVMAPTSLPMPPITEPPPPLRMPSVPPYSQPPPPGVFPMTNLRPKLGLVSPPGPRMLVTSGLDTPNHQSAITSSPPIGPPGVASSASVSLHPQYAQSEYNYDPEGYNPESPALTPAGRHPYRQFIPRVQTQRSNLIGLTSNTDPAIKTSNPGNHVPRFNTEPYNRKRTVIPSSADVPTAKKPWMEKTGFNNQTKSGFPKRYYYVNTKLEVRKIPQDLNNITQLNKHFSKFGTIVNIQVAFGGDPEAALIQYTKNEEARRAISSIEAVLNNRFICVYWHREPGTTAVLQQQEQSSGGQAATSSLSPATQHSNMHMVSSTANIDLQQDPPTSPLRSRTAWTLTPSQSLMSQVAAATANAQKSNYSPTALKTSKSLGKTAKALEAQEALKKKQEALKLQQDMRKKKQEMLKTQIECQKALINRLEKIRGMKPEERANIMKTLKELTEKIAQLQNEMNPHPASQVSTAKPNHSQPKTKTDAQKELLDAELDFHKKMSCGEDTTDLKRRLGQLQVEATQLGLIRPPTGRGRGRGKMEPGSMHAGRGRGRSREMSGRGGTVNRMVVDHRPRALAILGVAQEEKEELMPHFLKFGEIEDCRDQDANTVVMTFKTRNDAENAANLGAQFKGRMLQISWYKPKTPSVTTEPEDDEAKDEENRVQHFLTKEEEEEEDDDEDDEYESRSWRR